MTDANTLLDTLKNHATGTAYIIEPTPKGFVLKQNIIDKEYYSVLHKNGISRAFQIEATIDQDKKIVYTTDALYSLDWSGGTDAAPRLAGQVSVQRGEINQFETRKVYAITRKGLVSKPVDTSYSTNDAKRWLQAELKSLGWKRAWGREAKIGLVFAVIAGVGALITAVTLLAVLIVKPELFN